MSRHVDTILRRCDGAPVRARIGANNHRQALRRYARGTCRDQRVPANEFIKAFRAVYVGKPDGAQQVTH